MLAVGIFIVSVLFVYQIFLAVLACKNKLEITPKKTLLETVRSESQS